MKKLLAATLLLVTAHDPRSWPMAPVLQFAGRKEGRLVFEAANPNTVPLFYVGFVPSSFAGGLEEGTIAPLYRVETRRTWRWKEADIGWCGVGVGDVHLRAGGKAKFEVSVLPGGPWREVRVGLTWYRPAGRTRKLSTAWSEAVGRR
jgi:hypothetical protein